MNGGVRIDRIELEGFGLYRDATQFAFPEGLGVLIAPNESGKSTLLAGLVATIFGLPRSSDRDEFGTARFRNRGGGGRFRGALDLRVDGQRVRIRRDFETNEVHWLDAEGEGWRETLAEVHNPLARRAAGTYADRVREKLGIGSREIFAETFFVGQPMPSAAAIDARVQELLSGAGGGRYAAALAILEAALDARTVRRRAFGLSERDAVTPRALEQAQQEIASLRARLESDEAAVDGLHAIRARIADAQQRRAALRADVDAAEATLVAWQEWGRHRDRFEVATRRGRAAAEAHDRAGALAAEIAASRRALASTWPANVAFDPAAGAALEALATAVDHAAPLAEQAATIARQLQDARRLVELYERERIQRFGLLLDRDALLEDVGALQRASQRAQERARRQAAAAAIETEARARLDREWSWARIGEPAVPTASSLPALADEAIRRFDRGRDLDERLARAQREAAAGDGVFDGVRDDARALLRGGGGALVEARRARDEAARELQAARDDAARYEEARAPLAASFDDVSTLPDDLDEAIERKIEFGGRREILAADLALARDQRLALTRRRLIAGGIAAVAGFVGALWIAFSFAGADGFEAVVVGLLGAMAAGGAGYLLAGRTGGFEMAAREGQLAAEMIALDGLVASAQSDLGSLAAASLVDLLKARDRLKEWKQQRATLNELRGRVRGPEAMAALERKHAALDGHAAELEALVGDYVARFGADTASVFARWERAASELDALRAQEREAAAESWGVETFTDARRMSTAVLPPRWQPLIALADSAGGPDPAAGLENLVAWLRARDDTFWSRARDSAQAWDESRAALAALASAAPIGDADDTGDPDAVDALRGRVAPFDAGTDVDALARRLRALRALEASLSEARVRADALADQLRDVREKHGEADAVAARLRAPLRDLLDACGGSPREALRRWRGRQSARERLDASERTLREVLATAGAPTAEALADQRDRAEMEAVAATREIDVLRARHASLPALTGDGAVAIDREQARTRDTVQTLRAEVARVEQGLHEAQMREAELLGRDPLNLADAGERLVALQATRARIDREIHVLSTAHRELQAAVIAYHAAYRENLQALATKHFARIAADRGRRVHIADGFAVAIVDESGETWTPGQLSQGARDQLFLSLRLAVADLLAYERQLPLLLDDPFVNCDEDRLARIREILAAAAAERQILLFSHRRELAAWGVPVTVTTGASRAE